jgi:hypothetical protein
MIEENIVKLFDIAKDELIKNFDWVVENKLLRNFTKYQISFGGPSGTKSDFGVDIDLHIANSIKSEFSQSIMKTIIKELFKTNDYDFIDFSSEGISSSLLDMRHAREICERILDNNYKNLITNGGLGSILQDCSQFQVCPMRVSLNHSGVVYPIGKLGGYNVFVDPYMKYNDDSICLFDEVQINILNLNCITVVDESTFNPRYVLTYEMDFYINSVPKLLYVFTDKNSDNYKYAISKNRDIKIDKLLDDR